MTDIFDEASEQEQRERDAAIAAHRLRIESRSALSHCEDCGDEIPADRRQAVKNCRKCIECALVTDARRKLFQR